MIARIKAIYKDGGRTASEDALSTEELEVEWTESEQVKVSKRSGWKHRGREERRERSVETDVSTR